MTPPACGTPPECSKLNTMEEPDASALSPEWVAARLLDALRARFPQTEWLSRESQREWLFGVSDRWIAWISAKGSGVDVAIFGDRRRREEKLVFPVCKRADVDALLPEFCPLAAWWAGRLTVYRLQAGKVYAVMREFSDARGARFRPEEEHVFVESVYSPHDNVHALKFSDVTLVLEDSDPVVEDFDRYFRAG